MLWECDHCTSKRAVGLEQCPECGHKKYTAEGETKSSIPPKDDKPVLPVETKV